MFKETPEGKTYSCSHETKNESGVCDNCLGKDMMKLPKEEWAEQLFKICDTEINSNNKEMAYETIRELFADTLSSQKQELIKAVEELPTMYLLKSKYLPEKEVRMIDIDSVLSIIKKML